MAAKHVVNVPTPAIKAMEQVAVDEQATDTDATNASLHAGACNCKAEIF